nr:sulfhydryl oxidase 2-like [Leptinotarsa decemlineata]
MEISFFKFNLYITLLFVLIDLSISAVMREINNSNSTIYEQGLYSLQDEVEILTNQNFNKSIFGSERAWMVEFYSNWCGYCQRSAPIYKAFAVDVKNWNDLVGVGALDCANEENSPVCTYYGISKYPTFKYFPEQFMADSENLGIRLEADSHTNVSEHRRNLVTHMVKEQFEGRGKMLPNLKPFNYTDISKIFETQRGNPIYAFLIVQEPHDDVGASITMDFHEVKDIVVRYSYVNDTKLNKDLFPALYALEKGGILEFLSIPSAAREGFQMKISQYLMAKNVTVPKFSTSLNLSGNRTKPQSLNISDNEVQLREKIRQMGDVVFQVDFESVLRQSLKQEVGRVKEVTLEKLEALKKYISILEKYFPFGENGKKLLSKIKSDVFSNETVKGTSISKLVKDAEHPSQRVFSSSKQWLACRGSTPHSRGYPCGMWKLFHYLTVNVANCESMKKNSNPKVVLEAMHGYIKYFFGCEDCSNHFLEMAERRSLNKVASWNESILWLWRAHNEVNNRLSGDTTEDPEYPKVQFPTADHCPHCYEEDHSWNEAEVLSYLQTMYDNENIKYMGVDPQVLHLDMLPSSASISLQVANVYLVLSASLVLWSLRRG